MFKHLTKLQWAVFAVLTVSTVFGGLVYLVAENYFHRQDRDFAVAHPEPETKHYFHKDWNGTEPHPAPKVAYQTPNGLLLTIAGAFILGYLAMKGIHP